MATQDASSGKAAELKSEATVTLDGNAIKLADEALLRYFGPEYKSYIQISDNTQISPNLPYFDKKRYVMRAIEKGDPLIVPTPGLDRLAFAIQLPPRQTVHVLFGPEGTVIFVFLVFAVGKIQSTSPYMPTDAKSGDPIPTKHPPIDLSPYLGQDAPVGAPANTDLNELFSVEGKVNREAFMWKQVGADLDFKIAKKEGGLELYWQFSGISGVVEVADTAAQAMSARLTPIS